MYRRYRERRYHRHRNSNYNDPTRRLRSTLRRPSVQIGILLVVALIIYLILQSANQKKSQPNSLPAEISVSQAYNESQNSMFILDARTQHKHNIPFNLGFNQVTGMQDGLTDWLSSHTVNVTILEET